MATRSKSKLILALAVLGASSLTLAKETATVLPSSASSPLFWTQEERIVGFRSFNAIYQTRPVDHGTTSLPLRYDPVDFSDVRYQVGDDAYSLEHYLETLFVAGLLVAKGERVLLERYRLGHDETSRWVSFSIAKSVTSLLIGAAIEDGYIESVDEPVATTCRV